MGRLERKLVPAALAIALAKNPQPHRHASAGPAIAVGAPWPSPPAGKWPTPQYVARRKLKAERRARNESIRRAWLGEAHV